MAENNKIEQRIKKLFTSQKLAVLSTNNQGQPYASLVAFEVSADLKNIYFATTRATRKYRNIANEPRVAFLIDSRTNRENDFHEAIAVTACGRAVELDKEAAHESRIRYLTKHPYLSEFVGSPTCAFFAVVVESYSLVERFQQVTELQMGR